MAVPSASFQGVSHAVVVGLPRSPTKFWLILSCVIFACINIWYQMGYSMKQLPGTVALLDRGGDAVDPTIVDVTTTILPSRNNNNNRTHWIPSSDWIEKCVNRQTKDPSVYDPFVVSWKKYQLGDCIKLCSVSCESSINASVYGELSIAGEYWNHACNRTFNRTRGKDFDFLERLFQWYETNPFPYTKPWSRPADDELVIHLRIGDVMDDFNFVQENVTVLQMLRDGADTRHGIDSAYPMGIRNIQEFLTTIRESGLEKVVIRGGSHKPIIAPNSRIYSNCLKQAIRRAGYIITGFKVNGEENPDQDFYFMSRARYFYPSTGGYSRYIAQLVKNRGGTLVGRIFRQR